TFDPRIMTWNSEFTDAGRLGLGRGLTGDTVGSAYIPSVARLEQDVRLASGVAGFVASLGQGRLDRKSTRLNSSHVAISYAVFCFRDPQDLHSFPTRRSSDLRSTRES